VDPDETPAMKRVKQILANSEDPAAIAFLAGDVFLTDEELQTPVEDVAPKVAIHDYLKDLRDEDVAPAVGGYPAGSKMARAHRAATISNEQRRLDNFTEVRYDPTTDTFSDDSETVRKTV
jgi:hypothetical protein